LHHRLVLPNQEGDYAGEIHYILSRMTEGYRQFLREAGESQDIPDGDAIILLSSGIDQIVPGSAQEDTTLPIGTVINNLKSTLNALYAARFIKLAINADAPHMSGQGEEQSAQRLAIGVRVELLENLVPVGEPPIVSGVMEIPLGQTFQFVVTNLNSEAIYLSVLEVDQAGDVTPLFPAYNFKPSIENTRLEPDVPTIIPTIESNDLLVIETRVRSEFLFMVSRRSPRQAVIALRNDQRTSSVPVVDALLADISGVELERSTAQQLSLSTADFAAFSIPFRVV
jgi:hypothetical protein